MPWKRSDYPDNWEEIRRQVLLRAGGRKDDPRVAARCERCGVTNYSVGYWHSGMFYRVPYNQLLFERYREASEVREHLNKWCNQGPKVVVVVLTTAHMEDPDPKNVSLENLKALCQMCHNTQDAPMRAKNKANRKAGLLKATQIPLL